MDNQFYNIIQEIDVSGTDSIFLNKIITDNKDRKFLCFLVDIGFTILNKYEISDLLFRKLEDIKTIEKLITDNNGDYVIYRDDTLIFRGTTKDSEKIVVIITISENILLLYHLLTTENFVQFISKFQMRPFNPMQIRKNFIEL